jgi:iron complex transport system ATP-binding protein
MTAATIAKQATMIEARGLAIGYKPSRKEIKVVAENISATLRAGELVCLLGPNGAGKSTLMRTMAGMQKPLGGEVRLDGVNIHELPARELAKKLSVVLTERISVGAMTSYALVALGRYPHTNWAGTLDGKDHEVIQWALRTTGALEFAHCQIGELSDGERQKVMVARALAQEPQLMILDEITAFLDLPRRVEIIQMLRDLARKTKRAILLSTHDLDLALRSADRIWLLPKNGEMKIGAPEDLVLSGSFETVFASEGVEFDQQNGSFHIPQTEAGAVAIIGEGKEAFWTKRALERNGFQIDRSAPTRVEILTQKGATRWRMTTGGESRDYVSLDALVSDINS